MTKEEDMFRNYQKSVSERLYLGYAAISFRTTNFQSDSLLPFVLNSKGDGWFRRTEGNSDGYGLAINDFQITTRSEPITMGHYKVYKCKINFTDWSQEYKNETDFFWLYVHENFELEEILAYIEENKKDWYP